VGRQSSELAELLGRTRPASPDFDGESFNRHSGPLGCRGYRFDPEPFDGWA
jgi:hypothetical protein